MGFDLLARSTMLNAPSTSAKQHQALLSKRVERGLCMAGAMDSVCLLAFAFSWQAWYFGDLGFHFSCFMLVAVLFFHRPDNDAWHLREHGMEREIVDAKLRSLFPLHWSQASHARLAPWVTARLRFSDVLGVESHEKTSPSVAGSCHASPL